MLSMGVVRGQSVISKDKSVKKNPVKMPRGSKENQTRPSRKALNSKVKSKNR